MKQLVLSKDGSLKIKRMETSLYASDLVELPKSCVSGEWVTFLNSSTKDLYLGYVNSFVAQGTPPIRILGKAEKFLTEKSFEPKVYLKNKIHHAINYRKQFHSLQSGSRLIYGESDGLPGLIVDEFIEVIFVQINTAGLDQYRNDIRTILSEIFKNKKIIFFDQEKYRAQENLPQYEEPAFQGKLKIIENGLSFEVDEKVLQKIGYYYDHRMNRVRACNLIKDLKIDKSLALDLFCYIGSWGINLLSAGIGHVDFVDQGDFTQAISKNLELNNFSEKGQFFRQDVFKFLDQAIEKKKVYDVICSDPPAFAKNLSNKNQAIEGYQKLHYKILNLIKPGGLILIGSCTHYVTMNELEDTVLEAAKRLGKNLQLLDVGLQGPDHPIRKLNDKANYIKYLAYKIEN